MAKDNKEKTTPQKVPVPIQVYLALLWWGTLVAACAAFWHGYAEVGVVLLVQNIVARLSALHTDLKITLNNQAKIAAFLNENVKRVSPDKAQDASGKEAEVETAISDVTEEVISHM